MRTNDANNYIVGQISRTVFSEVRSAASTKSSRTFLDKIFVSFSTLHGKTEQAADGADRLEDGIGQAKHGTGKLADGLGTAKNGSGKLVTGLGDLDAGAGRLSRGSSDLARGAGTAAHGSRQLADGSGQVAQGTQQLADKVNGVVGKVGPFIRAHGKEIGEAAQLVADGSQAVRDHLDKLPAAASTGAQLSRRISDHMAAYYRLRCESGVRLLRGAEAAQGGGGHRGGQGRGGQRVRPRPEEPRPTGPGSGHAALPGERAGAARAHPGRRHGRRGQEDQRSERRGAQGVVGGAQTGHAARTRSTTVRTGCTTVRAARRPGSATSTPVWAGSRTVRRH